MDKYKIRCTKAQTRRAFELGAPINKDYLSTWVIDHDNARTMIDNEVYYNPTAEEMIGWLEEKRFKEIYVSADGSNWCYEVIEGEYHICDCNKGYNSRQEATIAAIDAALEYLIHLKNDE